MPKGFTNAVARTVGAFTRSRPAPIHPAWRWWRGAPGNDRTFVRDALTRWKQGCERRGLFPCLNSSCLGALGCGHGHPRGCRVWPLSQHPARPSYAIRAFGSRSSRLLRL